MNIILNNFRKCTFNRKPIHVHHSVSKIFSLNINWKTSNRDDWFASIDCRLSVHRIDCTIIAASRCMWILSNVKTHFNCFDWTIFKILICLLLIVAIIYNIQMQCNPIQWNNQIQKKFSLPWKSFDFEWFFSVVAAGVSSIFRFWIDAFKPQTMRQTHCNSSSSSSNSNQFLFMLFSSFFSFWCNSSIKTTTITISKKLHRTPHQRWVVKIENRW